MVDALKFLGRALVWGLVWVFILSIRVENRNLFAYANEYLVQNALVRTVDEHATRLWHKTFSRVRVSLNELSQGGRTAG